MYCYVKDRLSVIVCAFWGVVGADLTGESASTFCKTYEPDVLGVCLVCVANLRCFSSSPHTYLRLTNEFAIFHANLRFQTTIQRGLSFQEATVFSRQNNLTLTIATKGRCGSSRFTLESTRDLLALQASLGTANRKHEQIKTHVSGRHQVI